VNGASKPAIAVIGALLVALVLFIAFEVWVSAAEQIRSQRELLSVLKQQLDAGAEGGEAAPVKLGDPVGLLEAPSVGIEQVVVEGAGPSRLKEGPGHDPRSPLPGAAGISVIHGRHRTYGSPFRRLAELHPDDEILLTTALGRSRFRVIEPAAPKKEAELQLSTTPVLGQPPLVVRAELDGRPLVGIATSSGTSDHESGVFFPLVLEGVLLIATAFATRAAYRRLLPRVTFVLSSPVILALLLLVFGTADRLLPISV
jgi:hypothetical protein